MSEVKPNANPLRPRGWAEINEKNKIRKHTVRLTYIVIALASLEIGLVLGLLWGLSLAL